MPIYEYRCESCETVSEALVKIADRFQEQLCPECGGKAKLIVSTPMLKLPFNDPAGCRTGYDKWAKNRRQKLEQERKQRTED